MSQQQAKKKKNFHLPLAEGVYFDLQKIASERGRSATEFAREAIQERIKREKRRRIEEEISEYARKHAGSSVDLDPGLEAEGIEHLTRSKRKKDGRRKS